MPLVIPPGYCQINYVLQHTGLAREAQTTIGLAVSGASNNPVDLANQAVILFVDNLRALLDTEATLVRAECRLGQDGNDPLVGVNSTGVVAGLRSTTSVPPNVAILCHKRSASGGRRNRGRWYWPWFAAEGNVDENGVLAGPELANLQAGFNSWLGDAQTDALFGDAVILHDSSRYTTTRPSSTTKVTTRSSVVTGPPTIITALTVDQRVATQRRRLDR